MGQLKKLKFKVKEWESQFFKKNGYKPKQRDVDSAPDDIKDAFRAYRKLKKEAESQAAADAWGEEYNRNKETNSRKSGKTDAEQDENETKKSSFMKDLGQKLMQKVDFAENLKPPTIAAKPRPRRISPVRLESTSSSLPFSQNFGENTSRSLSMFGNQSQAGNTSEQSRNQSQHTSEQFGKQSQTRSVDKQLWSQSQSLSFAERLDTSCSAKIPAPKPTSVLPISLPKPTPTSLMKKYARIAAALPPEEEHATLTPEKNKVTALPQRPFSMFAKESDGTSSNDDKQTERLDSPSDTERVSNCDSSSNMQNYERIETTRPVKPVSPDDSTEQGLRDAFRCVNKATLPLTPSRRRKETQESSTDVNETPKRKSSTANERLSEFNKRLRLMNGADEETNQSVVYDVGWNTDEIQPLSNDRDEGSSTPPDESQSSTASSSAKIIKKKSGGSSQSFASNKSLNDNFVRLNMKVRRYRRKGQVMTGAKYKRMQWKNKMKLKSESFGRDKCFRCGQEGHWASKCPGSGASGKAGFPRPSLSTSTLEIFESPGEKPPVTDRDFPTASQALARARGCQQPAADSAADTAADEEAESEEALDIVRCGYEKPSSPDPIDPPYVRNPDGSLPEAPAEVLQALHQFGFDSFRPGQEKAVMRVLCGESTLVVLSTGAGKSLCYQLPAYIYALQKKALTLVISPLVSLMEDQVSRLPPCLKGACLHTTMTPAQRERVLAEVKEGKVHFLLVSPEALVGSQGSRGFLQMDQLPPVGFACIDEVHCLAEWSHHFRPSYLRISKILRESMGVHCILGLTATATVSTLHSVARHLCIMSWEDATIRGCPVPSNLQLSVSRDENREQALLTLLQGTRFTALASIIIYCTRREETERVAALIRTTLKDGSGSSGKAVAKSKVKAFDPTVWTCECYHAGLSAYQRKRVQTAFMSGRLRVVVATVAFGMGLDKADVRGIIHYNLPKSFESYVQEIGRAGRDGQISQCHVFLDHTSGDVQELRRHIHSNSVDRVTIKKLVQRTFGPCTCGQGANAAASSSGRVCSGHERALPISTLVTSLDVREEVLDTLLCYLELHQDSWIRNLPKVYGTCAIKSYGGVQDLCAAAQKCPPLALAIDRERQLGTNLTCLSSLVFPVVELSDSVGWSSGLVKRELKGLQWDSTNGRVHKTNILVEFSDLAFHLISPGDLTDTELDQVVEYLVARMEGQEKRELGQLHRLYHTLQGVSHKHVFMCSEHLDVDRSQRLHTQLSAYFEQTDGNETVEDQTQQHQTGNQELSPTLEACTRAEIRAFIQLYSAEHSVSGRAIARVLHGIPSPCYPAEVWGKVRRFWRARLDVDFHVLRKIATEELCSRVK